jgi:hypothetical protein
MEWGGVFTDVTFIEGEYGPEVDWLAAEVDGAYAAESMVVIVVPLDGFTSTADISAGELLEDSAHEIHDFEPFADNCEDVDHGSFSSVSGPSCFNLIFNTNETVNGFQLGFDAETDFCVFTEHLPSEFTTDEWPYMVNFYGEILATEEITADDDHTDDDTASQHVLALGATTLGLLMM